MEVADIKMTNVVLITPAWDEWPNLGVLAPDVIASLSLFGPKSRWIVVCEPSPPSAERRNLEAFSPLISVVERNPDRRSFATAIQLGLDKVGDSDDLVVFMDGDGSHDPGVIPTLVRELLVDTTTDVAIASRYVKGGKTDNSLPLQLMSRAVNFAFRLVLDIRARDLSTNFKAYRVKSLRGYQLTSTNFEAVEELLLVAQLRKGSALVIKEIPDHFRTRNHGESKRKLGQFVGSYLLSMIRLRRRVRSRLAHD